MIRVAEFLVDGVRVTAMLAMLAAVVVYRRGVSPWLPARCRYQPTCSAYAYEAIWRYGPIRGGWKAVSRVARCHPWSPGGWDLP